MNTPPLILASGSPYRRELLLRLGLPFEVRIPDVDESAVEDDNGAALAERLALLKARAVAAEHPEAVVIGSDQVAICGGRRLGKPGSIDRAVDQLMFCSGREVTFHTAVAVIGRGEESSRIVDTAVGMKPLDEACIRAYVEIDRPLDCAGSMKAEALGIALTRHIRSDDPTALIGLPLIALVELLEPLGITPISAINQTGR